MNGLHGCRLEVGAEYPIGGCCETPSHAELVVTYKFGFESGRYLVLSFFLGLGLGFAESPRASSSSSRV